MSVPKPYDVSEYGTDTSGRPIYLNARMKLWLDIVESELDFTPTIVQGAYMTRVPGGGASASAGYHDYGGCIDFRIWDLTAQQQAQLVRVCRKNAGWAWRRDLTAAHGGMDPHCHVVVDGDKDAAYGAKDQMAQYRAGLNGLASRGKDYEKRPKPTPPELDYYGWLRENMLNTDDKQWLSDQTARIIEVINARAKGTRDTVLKALDALPDGATKKDVRAAVDKAFASQTPEVTP